MRVPLSRGRKVVFAAVAVAVLLLLLECAFRVAGYGRAVLVVRVPELGWRLLPDQDRRTGNGRAVHVNALGCRDEEFPRAKPAGEFRVLIVGDSVTFGMDVGQDEPFPRRLHQAFQQLCPPGAVRFINAGVQGYDLRQYLLYVQRFGLDLAPDLVLVALYQNDVIINPLPRPFMEFPGRDLLRHTALFEGLEKLYMRHLERAPGTRPGRAEEAFDELVATYVGTAALDDDSPDFAKRVRLATGILADLARLCRTHEVQLAVALLPGFANTRNPDQNLLSRNLAYHLTQLGVPNHDLLPALAPRHPDVWLPHDEGHLSVLGHEVVARRLERWLRESAELTLPCR